MSHLERRSLGGLEIRAAREGNEIVVEDTASIQHAVRVSTSEKSSRPALRRTLRENKDILSMFNDDPNFLLGRSGNGTAEFHEDKKGLHYRARADADDPQSLSVLRKIQRGE